MFVIVYSKQYNLLIILYEINIILFRLKTYLLLCFAKCTGEQFITLAIYLDKPLVSDVSEEIRCFSSFHVITQCLFRHYVVFFFRELLKYNVVTLTNLQSYESGSCRTATGNSDGPWAFNSSCKRTNPSLFSYTIVNDFHPQARTRSTYA